MVTRNVKIGDNSLNAEDLKLAMNALDSLEQQKANTIDDIKDVYLRLKNGGYNSKIIKKLRKIIAQDAAERASDHELITMYADALDLDIDPFS